MIEVVIDSIRVSVMNYQRLVILKEKTAERYLPIWIGHAEADAIAMKLQGVESQRPFTHDLLRSVIETLGASVNFVVVNDLKNDNFYAKIDLRVDGREIEVDSRPSDALALAVRVEGLDGQPIPIYVEESVMDKAGVATGNLLGDTEKIVKESKKLTDEELHKLSPWNDVIDTIDWDDFEKRKS